MCLSVDPQIPCLETVGMYKDVGVALMLTAASSSEIEENSSHEW